MRLLFSEWLRKDPIGALDYAKENDLTDLVFVGLRVLGEQDPDAAVAWINDNTNDLFQRIHWEESVYAGLAFVNPKAAMARIEEISEQDRKQRLLLVTFDEWARQDYASAFKWIEQQKKTPFLADLYSNGIYQYIGLNPEKATSFISSLEENEDSVNFANRAAFVLAEQDATKAAAWVDSLTGESRYFASMGLLESWGNASDPKPALDFAVDQFQEPHGDELFARATLQIAQSNPDLLAQELPELDEEQQIIAAQQLGQAFSLQDLERTEKWVETLPEGPVRDAALESSLEQVRYADVEQAFRLSESVTNADQRLEEIQRTLDVWAPSDPQGALAALGNSSVLSEDLKDVVRGNLTEKLGKANDLLLPARSE